jgi:hypothetical protein
MELICGISFCDISIADGRLAVRKRKQMSNIEGTPLIIPHYVNWNYVRLKFLSSKY